MVVSERTRKANDPHLNVFFPSPSHARAYLEKEFLGRGPGLWGKGVETQERPGFRFDATVLSLVYRRVRHPLPDNPRVHVFASSSGAAAHAFKEQLGADVSSSDLRDCTADHARLGIPFIESAYHEMPLSQGTNVHFSFEPYPLTTEPAFMLGLLRSLANTTHGVALAYAGPVTLDEEAAPHLKGTFDVSLRRKPILFPLLDSIARLYGARYHAFTNGHWDVHAVIPSARTRLDAQKDVELIGHLERFQVASDAAYREAHLRFEKSHQEGSPEYESPKLDVPTVSHLAALLNEPPRTTAQRLRRLNKLMIANFHADQFIPGWTSQKGERPGNLLVRKD